MMNKHSIETELKIAKRNNSELLDANTKLADELKWAKEDKTRLQRRIDTALAYVNAEKIITDEKVRKALEKYGKIMTEILENDYYEC